MRIADIRKTIQPTIDSANANIARYTSDAGNQNKNIEVSIERMIENGEDLTNVVIKGEGDVTRKELEEELDRMLEKQGIDKAKTKLKIEMEIQS